MSQSKWREDIFWIIEQAQQEIEQINAELDSCPKDSPQYSQLYKDLVEKLKEYDQLPWRAEFQARKEARLDEISALLDSGSLSPEEGITLMDEGCGLISELSRDNEIEVSVALAGLSDTLSNFASNRSEEQHQRPEGSAVKQDQEYRAALQALERSLECQTNHGNDPSHIDKNHMAVWFLVSILAFALCAMVLLLAVFW
ncbi:MAG: hypothetical protein HFF98_06815 [Oscillibacter sp.]|jgi:hypothetical protein|nr:hypothetical protein [Oscillibacter sp.]